MTLLATEAKNQQKQINRQSLLEGETKGFVLQAL
jgi:hypothetical protein